MRRHYKMSSSSSSPMLKLLISSVAEAISVPVQSPLELPDLGAAAGCAAVCAVVVIVVEDGGGRSTIVAGVSEDAVDAAVLGSVVEALAPAPGLGEVKDPKPEFFILAKEPNKPLAILDALSMASFIGGGAPAAAAELPPLLF